ncbi:protein-L-isoaspartate(D-aspartate) O-methyltransferase [Nocardiopsis sp. CNR-923]|uniref:methyltransferase domain-containing protein n=1 Tax=Nocardiopsis sp. CNR-923 TaxID=1904965 RepID=UPI00095AFF89|nr:methyltransferase domain-containing protein [Nocardiopsis sp. CNR-923]OLT24197.1 protein-L-isoaspartate(D-aspartate) O-methyltransferase [Nocardiopsis sp. CNR-923]
MTDLDRAHSALTDRLDTTDAIRTAFSAHPRHAYISDVIWPSVVGAPLNRADDPDGWARAVYSDDYVTTQANDGDDGPMNTPTSSSSAPQLMADMIEAAGVGPGMRVLEIGTGSAWNAAILASLVGPEGSVTSVEIDPGVAAHARSRLKATNVEVVTGTIPDGSEVFDALIATCAVQRVPREWVERVGPDARLVIPWAPYREGGPTPVAALRRTGPGTASGPLTRDASFMRDRRQRGARQRFPGTGEEATSRSTFPEGSRDLLDNDRLTRLVLTCPGLYIAVGGRPWRNGAAPVVALGESDDWAHIWPDGSVTRHGTGALTTFTEAYTMLEDAGWPGLESFTLEVDAESGVHTVRSSLGTCKHPV